MPVQQKAPVEEQKVMVPIHPTAITTPTGLVMVWGSEHVSAKMLDVLKIMLSHDAFESVYHGVKSVVFRVDGYPKMNDKTICASFSPDVSGVSINLEKTLERAIDRSMDHPETSLLASWWLEMLLNFGHELHHGATWDIDRNRLHNHEEALTEEEEKAEKYSDSLIVELAQEYDIEMAGIEEETWFNGQIMELLTGKDDTDEWAKAQKEMLIEKVVWRHEPRDSEPVVLHTFKDLICLISDGNPEAEEWSKPTIPLTPNAPTLDEQLNGKKATMDAEGKTTQVATPVTEVASSDFAAGVFVNDPEDYSDIYEEGLGEYGECGAEWEDDCEEAEAVQPAALPAPLVTAADGDQLAINAYNFHNQASPAAKEEPAQTATINLTEVNRIAKGVYMKMFDFIFKNCGPLRDSDVGFSNPEAVLVTPILLTEEEKSIFVSMNHLDINGRWCPNVATTHGLLGKVMKNTKLPCYEVILNVNGTIHKRLFLPQNPNKRPNGVLTQRALEARAGNAIAYIKDTVADTWGPYIINGEYKLPQIR